MSSSILRSRHSFRVSIIDTYRTKAFHCLEQGTASRRWRDQRQFALAVRKTALGSVGVDHQCVRYVWVRAEGAQL